MSTGIVSILLHNLPYNGRWLYYICVALFALNVVLFIAFFIVSVLRYVLYPRIWSAMIKHSAQSMFLGTFPMALATIVNMVRTSIGRSARTMSLNPSRLSLYVFPPGERGL